MVKQYRKPHQYKRKKPIFKNRFFWLGILILIFLFFIFYFLFFSKTFQVEKIIVAGLEKVSSQELKVFVEEKLENKIFFLKTKSIFSVKLNKIKKDILDSFPQIAEVEIRRGIPNYLSLLLIERLGIANWCQEEKCFLLDNEGVIFEEVLLKTDLVKIIDKQSLKSFNLGEKVIEKDKLSKIVLEIAPELKTNLKIPLKEFVIVSNEKLEVFTIEDWKIYFNLQGDLGWQITKLRAVLEEKIPPEKRKDLEYIELRFGNLAPFKYKD